TLLDNPEPDAIYRRLVSQWERPDEVAAAGLEPRGPLWDPSIARDFPDLVPRMQFLDMVSYLPEDILTKVDRATMAVGLAGRVPLLDHRVVAYSWSLPLAFKVRGGRGKWLLRRVLDRYVPRSLIDRPKMGFGVPIDAWLRGPLREWAESLLAPARLASDGFVRVAPVRRAWQEHLGGTRNWQYPLWTVLMLQAGGGRWGGPCGRARDCLSRRGARGNADAACLGSARRRRRHHRRESSPRRSPHGTAKRGGRHGRRAAIRQSRRHRDRSVQACQPHRREPTRYCAGLDVSRRSRRARRARPVGTAQTDASRLEHSLHGDGSARLWRRAVAGGESLRAAVAMARSGDGQLGCGSQIAFGARLSPAASGGRRQRHRHRRVSARLCRAARGAHRARHCRRCDRA